MHRTNRSPTGQLTFVIALVAALVGWAQDGAGAEGDLVIAVLNVERVIRGSDAGRALEQEIDQVRTANQAKDRENEDALMAESEQLNKQRAVLSDEAINEKRMELQTRLDSLRQAFEERREHVQAAANEAWSKIYAAMLEVTEGLAAERGIDVVVSNEGTVLLSRDMNITKEVLDRLNARLSEVPLAIEAP